MYGFLYPGFCFMMERLFFKDRDRREKRKAHFHSFFFLMFVYFWERERERTSEGGAERKGDTESKAGSRPWAVSTEPDMGLEITNHEIMTWAKVGHSTDWAIQAPQIGSISIPVLDMSCVETGIIERVYSRYRAQPKQRQVGKRRCVAHSGNSKWSYLATQWLHAENGKKLKLEK